MYPTEASLEGFSTEELIIIHSIRILLGDIPTTIIEELPAGSDCANISMEGSVYQMENKGWPRKVVVSGVEVVNALDPFVDNYEYLVFSGTNALVSGISVMYDTFRFSDRQILDSFDYGTNSVLAAQCSLTAAQITSPLINLAAAVVLIQGEYQAYAEEAVRMQDGDSLIDTTAKLEYLQTELQNLRNQLQSALRAKLVCASYNLPVIRVE
ncbi:MAG: hypothetical protein DRP08_07335 [Candidatus Aenigmatarchaeota archaeon]|nr:MAG: hypothetical protein DRP08_07335 [Candidatus Aenigmarchaeota archaeon]